MKTLDQINKEKIVAIVRLDSSEHVDKLVESLYEGGIRVLEVTMNTPGVLEIIQSIKERYSDLLVGAGTVLGGESARAAISAGADFLLAPTLSEETIETGIRYGVPVIPGVYTPTEALKAYEYGAQTVKVFPVRSVGESFAKDLKGPLPFIKVMAVGGVSLGNVEGYLEKGWHSAGIGSAIVNPELIKNGNYEEITARAKKFIQIRDSVNEKR
ncbi:bifunctional 4-hydroxy-2-oxoglutarate aldolase/2-dehydro-3-deoxy-phosphogluconate aldolase [Halobacillus sp. Marseille-Q1614]|uniref:bifunctional 4-hydroxy-2-oxoglutarate aldolase/2-dehydro-3-deoxy-phosphogluconate aldolase n=1 Tax=Halobacillus sp. Marseille-Q1614 TaxID=2709134 RepID=UPI00156FFC8A|nr:bifunctional 4-hydroxy-2-oxoglutarate aldolase/2-dehydro-3-deoxy-phosphogluconate aldolase [Halobacillus sp. Marseille-Q1614]